MHFSVIKIRSCDREKNSRYMLHCVQMVPKAAYKQQELERFFTLTELGHTTEAIAVLVSMWPWAEQQTNSLIFSLIVAVFIML